MLVGVGLGVAWRGSAAPDPPPSPEGLRLRNDALARAKVLRASPFNASAIDFSKDPNTGVVDPDLTTCKFLPTEPTGTPPKFTCLLESGERIKVKYGWTDEIPSEVAATRLLHALGFAADRVSRVHAVRCYGCVVSPFHVRWTARMFRLGDAVDRHLDYDDAREFKNVSVERKLEGHSIDAGGVEGWSFYELSQIDPSRGGATRGEVDALRLMAAFLGHWDNKAENQRLLCEDRDNDAPCTRPVAMLQDVGSEFGPHKVNLEEWKRPIWAEVTSCTLSMKSLPYDGATFPDVRISEEGRRLLGDRLKQLSPAQIATLFASAGFTDVDKWVTAFRDKVRQIVERNPCPMTMAAS